jgi:hypothetical protein
MTRARAACVLAALLAAPAGAAPPERGLGINLHGVRYWSPALPFVDVFRQSGEWVPQRAGAQAWNTGEALALDERGWVRSLSPGQEAATIVMGGGRYPAGRYRVTYDGRGEVFFGLDAKVVGRAGRALEVEVSPQASVVLKILRSDPADPVRNIRMLLPGFDGGPGTPEFNPAYLEYLRGFRVLRFMDWANANETALSQWDRRPRPEDASQSRRDGVALELMIAFARAADAAPWFTVPHAASDDYVRKMALLLRTRMEAGARFYLEYSNEVWNTIFPQHAHAAREAARLKLEDADAYYVRRSLEIFRIFEEVFGGRERFVRVLSGQAVNLWRARKLLGRPELRGGVDAYAIAPYFGHASQLGEARGLPHEELMARLERAMEETVVVVRANVQAAKAAGVALIAYEGGQHVTNPAGAPELCAALNRDPRMEALYERYLDLWSRETGDALMVLFADVSAYGQHGCWGLAEHLGQGLAEAPKLRAVRRRLAAGGATR